MPSEAASSPEAAYAPVPSADGAVRWTDDLWVACVGSVDGVLRAWYGIYEFTDDPACVLRVGLSRARIAVMLSDGTQINPDDPIGTLHLWNEHLPRYSGLGPDLAWAGGMRRRVNRSLRALADHIERDPLWREVPAFRGEAALSSRLGALQLRRVAERYGFEEVRVPSNLLKQMHALGESFSAWGLTRAFNPAALSRQRFFRRRYQLWISRERLLRFERPVRGRGIAAGALRGRAV